MDTNVLLRLLIEEDSEQCARSRAFFSQRTARDPAFVSSIVLAELIWHLRRRFRYTNDTILRVLGTMTQSAEFRFEHGDKLRAFLAEQTRTPSDVADAMIAWSSLAANCDQIVTFDKRSAKKIPSMELLA
ncbi:PIN domain-containing protein [Arvimicrobium flavum]|uniref:PIN domain-containing protein n=1 Tax=Arvimicrobium flavum TaxID=3393320 RepID=UPI00237A4F96|nr:PIN domain-containing protein [Mesorhizobium shangrilense]